MSNVPKLKLYGDLYETYIDEVIGHWSAVSSTVHTIDRTSTFGSATRERRALRARLTRTRFPWQCGTRTLTHAG